MKYSRFRILVSGLACSLLISFTASSATFTVNTTVDAVDANIGNGVCQTANANECTLRAAVQEANALIGLDTIELPTGIYTLSINGWREDLAVTGDLDITDDLSIIGSSITNTIIDANKLDRVFDIFGTANVLISMMTIQNGDMNEVGVYFPEHGGGIRNMSTLELSQVNVLNNAANLDMGVGGGIYNLGTLYLTNVAINGNSASRVGGLANYSDSDATLLNVTISNNTSWDGIAGIHVDESATAMLTNVTISGNVGGGTTTSGGGFRNIGDATLINVTITGNTGAYGAGISLPIIGPFSPVTRLKNTIVANNIGKDCYTWPITSLGYNLDSDNTCGLIGTGDIVNTDPLLGPLQDNGGFTLTHALLPGSPAIDTGSPDCPPPSTDQRGELRPIDGNDDGIKVCDIGAYEVQPPVTFIDVDVKPYSQNDNINPRSSGLVAVAVLTSDVFDALQIDPDTVQFGPDGAAKVHGQTHVMDVDNDGDTDLLFHFRMTKTGIQCGDTEATLTGQTWDETLVSGTDNIRTVGCR